MSKKMDLRTYLFTERITYTDSAKQLGVKRQTIWKYCNGGWPQPKIAKRIEEWSKGIVTVDIMLKGRPKPKVCECCGRKWLNRDTRKQPELF